MHLHNEIQNNFDFLQLQDIMRQSAVHLHGGINDSGKNGFVICRGSKSLLCLSNEMNNNQRVVIVFDEHFSI